MVTTGIAKSIKLCKNLIESNFGVMMSAEPHENTSAINSEGKNYFQLPFEAYYSEHLAVTILDFQSDIDIKKFEDIKVVHREQGGAWGVTFRCSSNTGPELYCCIKNLHDEVAPEWLEFLDEENIEFNSGDILPVSVKKGEIVFMELSDAHEDENSKEYLDIGSMENCCTKTFMAYEIADSMLSFFEYNTLPLIRLVLIYICPALSISI